MDNKRKIQFIMAAAVVVCVVAVIFTRNSPRYTETQSRMSLPDTTVQFNSPSKANVSSSFSERVALLKKSVLENPANAAHLIALAQLLMDGHQNNEAIYYFEKAADLQPKNDTILLDLSVCYFNAKEYNKALKASDKILTRNPSQSRALYNKGAILASLNRKDEAVTVWKDLIRRAPQSEEARSARGHITLLEKK